MNAPTLPGPPTGKPHGLLPSPLDPEGSKDEPFRYRARGIARGRIIQRHPNGRQGLIEIDGFRYEFEDCRSRNFKIKHPLGKFLETELTFSFWPTFDAEARSSMAPDDSPVLKIASLRKVGDANFVEVIGVVDEVGEEHLTMAIYSTFAQKTLYTMLVGTYDGRSGDLLQIFGRLGEGIIRIERINRLTPAPGLDDR